MIFDLVEAAQEFLSEIAPTHDSVSNVSQLSAFSWHIIECITCFFFFVSSLCIVKGFFLLLI
jgi:hypothetical protein